MISQNNSDYMAWSQFLKGNYGKGVKRLESILNSPPQAADLIKDKAALAVIFGGYDKQTDGLLSVVASSKYADQMVRSYIGSVADSDAAFASAATPEMVESVCLASSASAACAKQVWKNDPERFVARAKSDVQLDLAAKAFKGIDVSDFASVPASLLSKLSPYVGKNDRSGYLHLVGQELEIAVDSCFSSYSSGNDYAPRRGDHETIVFVVVDVNADEQEDGSKVGFTLASKYPLYFSSNDSSYVPTYNITMTGGYSDSIYEDPNGNYQYVQPGTKVTRLLDTANYKTTSSSVRAKPLISGGDLELAREVKRPWASAFYVTSANSGNVKLVYGSYRFWQPNLGEVFGSSLPSKVGSRFCTPVTDRQYELFKDFDRFASLSVAPDHSYQVKTSISDGKFSIDEVSYQTFDSNDNCPNCVTSSYMTKGPLTGDSQMLCAVSVSESGELSAYSSGTSSFSRSYMPNIYMCI